METLPGACAFTDDPEAMDPVWLVREVKRYPQFLAPLRAKAAELLHDSGRDREPGDWVLLYLGYVFSGETRVQRFCARWRSSAVWAEAGFGDWQPSYQTVWLRFDELERCGVAAAMRAAGDLTVRQAKRHEDRIGRDTAVDATSYEAHARLVHCCPDRHACRALPRFPQVLGAAAGDTVEKQRHRDAKQPPELTEGGELDNRLRDLPQHDPRRDLLPEGPRYYLQHGHVYRALDATAGARRYDKEFWVGGLLMASVDILVGAPLALHPIAADESEARHYGELLDRTRDATGAYPDRVTGDRGYSFAHVFEHNSKRGIASAFPWRKPNGTVPAREDADCDEYDRHGIPRCRHCGGPGDLTGPGLGFHLTRGEPVLRFTCLLGLTADCKPVQQISCSLDPRMLVPLSRLTDQYNALRKVGKSMERVWRHWRDRYGVAGKTIDTRTLRRQSRDCQELRAQAARFIEWFRILLRHGWAGSHRHRNDNEPTPASGAARLRNILRARDRHGLDLPYGRYAIAAGFAPDPAPPPGGVGPPAAAAAT